jgi:hypothetical protein
MLGFGPFQRRLAVAHTLARVALEAEVQTDQFADVRFVLHDENSGRRRHSFMAIVFSHPGHVTFTDISSNGISPSG